MTGPGVIDASVVVDRKPCAFCALGTTEAIARVVEELNKGEGHLDVCLSCGDRIADEIDARIARREARS